MRLKFLVKCIISIAILLFVANTQAQVDEPLINETFNNGLPNDWTQEFVSGNIKWESVSDADDSVCTSNAVVLKNKTNVTQKYKTILSTPVFNPTVLYDPVLIFSYITPQWAYDSDSLRILYKTSEESQWISLKEIKASATKWVSDTVSLNAVNSYYKIAFEGTDNLGKGIYIDNVVVRNRPACIKPYNVYFEEHADNSLSLYWFAGFVNPENFYVKVSSKRLSGFELQSDEAKADVLDTVLNGDIASIVIKGLESNFNYYCYIRSECGTETSDWSDEFMLRVKTLQSIPCIIDFNYDYTGYNYQMQDWYFANDFTELSPYVNTANAESVLCKYSKDCSSALCFFNRMDKIPAGKYSLAATPEIAIDKLSKLQISFTASSLFESYVDDRDSLIIGAISDPNNIDTFEPIDTVSVSNEDGFKEYIVLLSSYSGVAKHIAFLSNFKSSNAFVIDDLHIEPIKDCNKALDIRASIISSSNVMLKWTSSCSDVANIIVADTLLDINDIDSNRINLIKEDFVNGGEITGLKPWSDYYIYLRSNCDNKYSDWGNVVKIHTPQVILELPDTISFEINENDANTYYLPIGISQYKLSKDVIVWSNATIHPSCKKNSNNGYSIELRTQKVNNKPRERSTLIFPELKIQEPIRIEFESYTNNNEADLIIGYVTSVNDTSSFVSLDTIQVNTLHKNHVYYLEDQLSSKGFFAIRNEYSNKYSTYQVFYVDNVAFSKAKMCRAPMDVDLEVSDIDVIVKWNNVDNIKWQVKIAEQDMYDKLNDSYYTEWTFDTILNTSSCKFEGLKPNGAKYYMYIRSVCDLDTSEWSDVFEFMTLCSEENALPYQLNFDDTYVNKTNVFPVPCLNIDGYSSSSLLIDNYQHFNGKASLHIKTKNTDKKDLYVILPKMKGQIQDMMLSFQIRNNVDIRKKIEIGVMSDINDVSTFENIAFVGVSSLNKWTEKIISFSDYKGKGEYISIKAKKDDVVDLYVDSIVVDLYPNCPKVSDMSVVSTTSSTAVVTWNAFVKSKYDVVVSERNLSENDLNMSVNGHLADGVVYAGNVTKDTLEINELKPSTKYYFYVRVVCQENVTSFWSQEAEFVTQCAPISYKEGYKETFDSYGIGRIPNCWNSGNFVDMNNNSFMPKIVSGEYKHSGYMSVKFNSTVKQSNGAYLISPEIGIDSINKVILSFWGSCGNYVQKQYKKQLIVGVVSSPSDVASFVPIDTVYGNEEDKLYYVSFSNYYGDQDGVYGKYIMFLSEFDSDNVFYIDDVKIDTLSGCMPYMNIKTDAISDSSVAISWGAKDDISSSIVVLSESHKTYNELSLGANVLYIDTLEQNSVRIDNLKCDTRYYIYVGHICDDNEVKWSLPHEIRTECANVLTIPYKENFESINITGIGVNPTCWISYFGNEQKNSPLYPAVLKNKNFNNELFIMADGDGRTAYAVLPWKLNQELVNCDITFDLRGNTADSRRSLVVGLASNIDDENALVGSFVPMDTILCISEENNRYSIQLDDYCDKDSYLVFTSSYNLNNNESNAGVYIDNVEIDYINKCKNVCHISNIDVSNNSVVLHIDKPNDVKCEVGYVLRNAEILTDMSFIETEDSIISVNGLINGNVYDFYIRTVCEADKSKFDAPVSCRMPFYINIIYPYEEDFENSNEWQLVNDGQVNAWYIGEVENSKTLYISSDNGNNSYYDQNSESVSWAYTTLSLDAGVYIVDYDWSCLGESMSDYIRIGLMPSNILFNSGSNLVSKGNNVYSELKAGVDIGEFIALDGSLRKLNGQKNGVWQHQTEKIIIDYEKQGLYNLVILWVNNSGGSYVDACHAMVDNIKIAPVSCSAPINSTVKCVTDVSAIVSWEDVKNIQGTYEIFVTTNKDLASPDFAVDGDTLELINVQDTLIYELKSLQSEQSYSVFVRAVCDENDKSEWSDKMSFKTLSSPHPIGRLYSFEEPGTDKTNVPDGFIQWDVKGQVGYYNFNRFPYLVNDNIQYAKTGKYALYIQTMNVNQTGSYISLPLVDGNLNDMQISFWMRPMYNFIDKDNVKGKVDISMLDSNYNANSVTVGILEDPFDPLTLQEVKICKYPYSISDFNDMSSVYDDINANNYWVKYSVPLKGYKGRHIAFLNGNYGKNNNTIFIDDVIIEPINYYAAPYDLNVSDITDTSAVLHFASDFMNKWFVQVALDHTFDNIVFEDTVINDNIDTIYNLMPTKSYYVKVSAMHPQNMPVESSLLLNFSTINTVCFKEDFSIERRIPDMWRRAKKPDLYKINDINDFEYLNMNDTVGWSHKMLDNMASNREFVSLTDYFNRHWLFTPFIYLPNDKEVVLSFDLAITRAGGPENIHESEKGKLGNKFAVIVIVNDTIDYDNMILWDNTQKGDFIFDEISNKMTNMKINLSRYAGKSVSIAFYAQSEDRSYIDIHIDNVRINSSYIKVLSESMCQSNSYYKYGFEINNNEYILGDNTFYKEKYADNNDIDTIYQLNLHVDSLSVIYINDIVCEGEPYNNNGFNVSKAGTYKRKLQAANGCDSVIVLNLDVIPAKRVEKTDSICVGGNYTWNGNEYIKPGVYSDTLKSNETGCDSIVTLTLLPIKEITVSLDTAICYGETLKIGEEEIRESGNHTVRLESVQGCDSVINVSLTILPEYKSITNAVICKGESYSDDIFKGLKEDTFTKMTVDSKEKCDSTVTLNLVVIENGVDKEVTVDISVNDLPYQFFDKEFGKDTKPGTYTEEMELGNGNCKATVRLTLNVSDEVGYLPTRTVKELVLTPNPINAGEDVTVNAEFTEKELSDMTVEVYTSSGTKVMSFRPEREPVTIGGLTVSGVYMVRLITGEGTVYQGKIVVR